jgi:hypothetical protein
MVSEEEQTTQWPKEKVQKDKQRSTKHAHKSKDRLKRTPLKTESELMFSGRGNSSCFNSGIRRVTLVAKPEIRHECRKTGIVISTNRTYLTATTQHQ